MPKIKVVLTQEMYQDGYSDKIIREGLTDWDEVTEEQLNNLLRYLGALKCPAGFFRRVVRLENDLDIQLEKVKKLIRKAEDWRIEYEAKRGVQRNKKVAKEKAIYLKLKKKFEKGKADV